MLTQTIEKSYKHKACIIVIIIKASYILQHIYVVQNTKLKQRKNKQRIQGPIRDHSEKRKQNERLLVWRDYLTYIFVYIKFFFISKYTTICHHNLDLNRDQ